MIHLVSDLGVADLHAPEVQTQPNTFYSRSTTKKMMCFIINYRITCHSQHLRGQKSNMAATGMSRLCHINYMSNNGM